MLRADFFISYIFWVIFPSVKRICLLFHTIFFGMFDQAYQIIADVTSKCVFIRWFQLGQIQSGMRAFHGPLRALRRARSFIFLARTRARWGR
jgi:hypothetical protein